MLDKLKAEWQDLKRSPGGQRFVQCYHRHQARDAPWLKPFLFFSAVFSFVIGVVLAFVPGPAILFFLISGALLAAESRFVATAFDKVELFVQGLFGRVRAKRRRRQARAETRVGRIDPHDAEILRAAAAAAFSGSPLQPSAAPIPAGEEQYPQASAVDMSNLQVPHAAPPVDMSNLQAPQDAPPVDMSNLQARQDAPPVDMSNLQAPQNVQPVDMSKLHVPANAAPIDMSKLHVPATAAPVDLSQLRVAEPVHPARDPHASRPIVPASERAASIDMSRLRIPDAGIPSIIDEIGAPQSLHAAATRHVHIESNTKQREIFTRTVVSPAGERELPVPPPAASTKQGHAPMDVLAGPRTVPLRVAGTVKIWASDPAHPGAFQNAKPAIASRTTSQKAAVVLLAPPAIIGGENRKRPSVPRADRRATPPPPPRRVQNNPSRA
jgi:hypothetical protein